MPANPSFVDWAISTYAPMLVPANLAYRGIQRLSDMLNYEAQAPTYDPSLAVPANPSPELRQFYYDVNGYPIPPVQDEPDFVGGDSFSPPIYDVNGYPIPPVQDEPDFVGGPFEYPPYYNRAGIQPMPSHAPTFVPPVQDEPDML